MDLVNVEAKKIRLNQKHNGNHPVGVSRKGDLRLFDVPPSKSEVISRSIRQIVSTMVVLELRRCHLTEFSLIVSCSSLRFCCLAGNKIKEIPPTINQLNSLEFLNISSNLITSMEKIKHLRLCPSRLLSLDLSGNPVTAQHQYRDLVLHMTTKSSC